MFIGDGMLKHRNDVICLSASFTFLDNNQQKLQELSGRGGGKDEVQRGLATAWRLANP